METRVGIWIAAAFLVLFALHVASAQSTTIDFEAQGAGAPSAFDGPKPPITIGSATFSGGQLLFHETLGVDQTAVYATNFIGGYGNPLTIHFAQPVNGFSLLLTNESDALYTVADNLGGSQTSFLSFNQSQTFTLSDSGITSVSIFSDSDKWDFAIDDVTYNTIVPEPATLSLVGLGAIGLAAILRRGNAAR